MAEAIEYNNNDNQPLRLRTNLSIWVFYSTDRFQQHISEELIKSRSITFETISFHSLVVANLSHFTPPDMIFVETGPNWAQKIIELQEYEDPRENENQVETALIVFGNQNDNGALRIALKIGAEDFVSDSASIESFWPLLKSHADEKVASREYGDVILFLNTKGGAGASMLAANCAIEMAQSHPNKVLLLDLDIQFGVGEDYLNLSSPYCLTDALANVSDLDEVSMGSFVAKHDSGLHVLGFKHESNAENYDKVKHLGKLIPLLREYYTYIVIDLSRGLDKFITPVVSQSTKTMLVVQQNLASIRNTTRIAKILAFEYGVHRENIEIVVNRYEKRQAIKVKDIKGTIGGVKIYTVPNDYKTAVESANLGNPFVVSKKNSAISKAVKSIARTLFVYEQEQVSWVKRLFGRS